MDRRINFIFNILKQFLSFIWFRSIFQKTEFYLIYLQNFTDAQRQHVPATIMAVLYNSEPEPEPEPEQEEETIESYVQKQEP